MKHASRHILSARYPKRTKTLSLTAGVACAIFGSSANALEYMVHVPYRTKTGCITYKTDLQGNVAQTRRNTKSVEWSASCEPGKPIEGLGTLTVTMDERGLWSRTFTGNFVAGSPDGAVDIATTQFPKPTSQSYTLGCREDEVNPGPNALTACKPRVPDASATVVRNGGSQRTIAPNGNAPSKTSGNLRNFATSIGCTVRIFGTDTISRVEWKGACEGGLASGVGTLKYVSQNPDQDSSQWWVTQNGKMSSGAMDGSVEEVARRVWPNGSPPDDFPPRTLTFQMGCSVEASGCEPILPSSTSSANRQQELFSSARPLSFGPGSPTDSSSKPVMIN